LISSQTEPFSGFAATADEAGHPSQISPEHAARLVERGLNVALCARMGVHTVNKTTVGFHYFVNGEIHDTKLRHGKGNMPWRHGPAKGRKLVAYGIDSLRPDPEPDEEVIITEGEFDAVACVQVGNTRVLSVPNGAQDGEHGFEWLYVGAELHPDIGKFASYIIATDGDARGMAARDALAVRLGDAKCRWVKYPPGCKDPNDVLRMHGPERLREILADASPMWSHEVASIDDIPDPPEDEPRYRLGLPELDRHGIRITLPCLWTIIGPYSSGKSVLLRQIVHNLWTIHGFKILLSALEERVKPRFLRDLRRHAIGRGYAPDNKWTVDEIAAADDQIREGFRFLLRPQRRALDPKYVLKRVEYGVQRYGIKVVVLDPMNEIEFGSTNAMQKTEILGEFLMALKDMAEDYGLLIICCAHTTKSALSDKMRFKQLPLLRMDDAEDSRFYANKSDLGWCVWQPQRNGPSFCHLDKIKDHETMGRPTIAELTMDRSRNRFNIERLGYDILKS
jgi:twinkle protein